MSALLGRGWCQKLYLCNVGLNSPTFTSVKYFKFNQSYVHGATRVLQKGRICTSDSQESKLNTLARGQLPSGLHKEHRKCVTDQAVVRGDQPGATLVRMRLPMHERPNGIVHGGFLVENIIQTATVAANRYCSQQIDTHGERSRHGATLCFLSSFDDLKYIRPFQSINAIYVKANVTAKSDHLLRVEVSIEKNYPLVPEVFKLANSARLSFITNDHHDLSQRHRVISQQSHSGALGDSHLPQPTPSKVKDSSLTNSDIGELIPDGSSFSFIQPYDCTPPQHLFCQPGHVCKLMEEHGIILASRLTHHDVVCVHVGAVTFHENIKIGNAVITSGEVVSTAKDVVTMFLTVISLGYDGPKIRKRCVAEGLYSYVPINSTKERVSIPGHQILSGRGQSFVQDKEVGIEHNVVDSYVNALKKLSSEGLRHT